MDVINLWGEFLNGDVQVVYSVVCLDFGCEMQIWV